LEREEMAQDVLRKNEEKLQKISKDKEDEQNKMKEK
tara:strand:- start:291 stop:398 length:108 start_codon:yes stop_codon:yes gene_type:complete